MDWNQFQYFLKVADRGNLNAAARELGVNHSTVFRRINSLENRLNVRLFDRTRKGCVLTEAGEEIFSTVQQIEDQMFDIQRKLLGKDIRLSGNLKISTTDTIGYYWLPPYIKVFKELYPEILIDLDIQIRFTNLTKREADIVIPAVNIQPDFMVGRKLAPIYFRLYASKPYVDKYGLPATFDDFPSHRFLFPNEALATLSASLWLKKNVPAHCVVAASDKLTTLFKFAQQDMGIAALPHYVGQSDGQMVEIMELPDDCHRNVWILTHPDLRNTARVKAFMQFIYQQVKRS
ncbi:MAG: LysR family transcriptional regulator [Desulfobacterales bacterium]|nr:LysR family transcriptional regulator [Desulfobacterales bacterium]